MTRHIRWIVPFALAPVFFFGLGALGGAIAKSSMENGNNGAVFLVLLCYLGAIVGGITCLIVGIVQAARAGSKKQPPRKLSKAELATQRSDGWGRAWHLRQLLLRRELPPTIQTWEVMPRDGEVFFIDTGATYARYYGRDVHYSTSSGFFFGRPAFVLAGLAATAVGNSMARSQAQAQAQAQWREWQQSRVIVSNQRVICNANGGWLSFDFGAISAVYPEPASWTLVLQFHGSAAPLMLTGFDVPSVAVMVVQRTFGTDALAQHPAMLQLE